MRRIDYWVGVPACFAISLLQIFRSRTVGGPVKRALFIELSEMGSAVLADPAMRKLRGHTGAELYFLIFERNRKSLKLTNTITPENVCTIRENNLFVLAIDAVRFLFWARKNRIDTVIDLELFSRFSAILTGLSGARQRAGFYAFHNEGLYRGNFMTHRVAYNPHMHIAKNFLALTYSLTAGREEVPYSKVVINDSDLKLHKPRVEPELCEDVRRRITRLFPGYDKNHHKLVLVNSNASELLTQRRWMPEYYAELITKVLANHQDVLIVLTGSKEEYSDCEALKTQVKNDRCVNSAGQFEFEQLPALYTISHLMISNDSGPGHFSSVTDLKVFIFFGPETPALYGSLGNAEFLYSNMACSPCVSAANHRKTSCTDNQCLKVILPQHVYAKILPDLERSIELSV